MTNAQVLLLWALQKGYSVIPKSTNAQHIQENIDLPVDDLCLEDIEALDTINISTKYAWNSELVQ